MNQSIRVGLGVNKGETLRGNGNLVDVAKTDIETSVDVAGMIVKRTNDTKDRVIQLEERYKEAIEYLIKNTDGVRSAWLDWTKESKSYLEEVRQWRMAIERESKVGVRTMQDMLEFIGDEKTATKLKTVREFVELAERMEALNKSGFLNVITDVMLKLNP